MENQKKYIEFNLTLIEETKMQKNLKDFRNLLIASTLIAYSPFAFANDVVFNPLPPSYATSSDADRANAQSRLPMLDNANQLPSEVKKVLGISDSDLSTQGYGTGNHPFTTKLATTKKKQLTTIKLFPYSATGKLWMRFDTSLYVCTASVIDKGLLVTAAHCVHNYGEGSNGFADQVLFEPSRHAKTQPHGVWSAVDIAIPAAYVQGTDACDVEGVVCENDIAIVILDQLNGKYVENAVGGKYNWKANNWGYANFNGIQAAQITQLGYPSLFDDGYKMIRTDSLGYQASPNNVVIGSDQTGGSSGGPWLLNFGIGPKSQNDKPKFNSSNTVMATTSWGYVSGTVKVQGASRFAKNSIFTSESNIKALHGKACTSYPDHCN